MIGPQHPENGSTFANRATFGKVYVIRQLQNVGDASRLLNAAARFMRSQDLPLRTDCVR
jgi:hypothetical protein